MKIVILKFITLYQFFSKDLNPYKKVCVFTPTCSEYTYDAVKKYGACKGVYMGIKRIIRCHPKQKEYYDPLL